MVTRNICRLCPRISLRPLVFVLRLLSESFTQNPPVKLQKMRWACFLLQLHLQKLGYYVYISMFALDVWI